MNIQTQKRIVNILAALLVVAAFSLVGNEDMKAEQAAADHAQYVKQLAKQEADERKAEFNRLAFEGERLTGYAGDMK